MTGLSGLQGADMPRATRVPIEPYDDQRPGTSGLRKKTRRFREPHYLAALIQAIFHVQRLGGPLVLGGDGRFFSDEAVQTIFRIAAANGCSRIIVGRGGLLSTPAASNLIRERGACGGIILSASHNPAGPDGDFGVKFNGPSGAPASEGLTEAVYELSRRLTDYRMLSAPAVDVAQLAERRLGNMIVEVVDPTSSYADLMERLFDFDRIASLLAAPGFQMRFDAMHAVTGPYAYEIFHRRLGAPADAILRGEPLADFGGVHPDPTPANTPELTRAMSLEDGPNFGAASDGDGDRHLVMGRGFPVNPSDSLAVMLANASLIPGYAGRVTGVARSMPTSRAVDAVAAALNVPCFETPTGWKFFGSLLDAGRITLCGEESAGAGSDHVREKDGVWAVLYWLNLVAARGLSVEQIVQDHWRTFGRYAAQRLDFENLPQDRAELLMEGLRERIPTLVGASLLGRQVEACNDFTYRDPVTGAVTAHNGVRLFLSGGGRIVFRLSGTGTTGATLRVYLDQQVTDLELVGEPARLLTLPLEKAAIAVSDIETLLGVATPTHKT